MGIILSILFTIFGVVSLLFGCLIMSKIGQEALLPKALERIPNSTEESIRGSIKILGALIIFLGLVNISGLAILYII